jgi:integrating conjugative element membrane protein (TIGR03745 family)
MTVHQITQRLTSTLLITAAFLSSMTHAGLPQMDAPSRGEGGNIIETIQNYAFDGTGLIALLISTVCFCGVAYHAYGTYAEVQTGKKTWGQFGLTCTVGAVLLVLSIWLLTKATGIL